VVPTLADIDAGSAEIRDDTTESLSHGRSMRAIDPLLGILA
jgi:hypothetical protein